MKYRLAFGLEIIITSSSFTVRLSGINTSDRYMTSKHVYRRRGKAIGIRFDIKTCPIIPLRPITEMGLEIISVLHFVELQSGEWWWISISIFIAKTSFITKHCLITAPLYTNDKPKQKTVLASRICISSQTRVSLPSASATTAKYDG